jgi:hypothetical protein
VTAAASRVVASEVVMSEVVTSEVSHLPYAKTCLTVRAIYRQSDRMPKEPLLYGRVHVDLARTASARCPGC